MPPARRAPPSARRARRARRRNQRSDLGARIFAAIPAVIFAILIVDAGGLLFAVALIALGWVCLHELYALFDRVRPVRLAGFVGLAGLLLAANYGDQFQVLLVAVAILPLLFALSAGGPPRTYPTLSMAVTLLGVYWIGLALAHGVLLRQLPHGDGVLIDVLVGTFVGDTGAYLAGRVLGVRPLAPRLSPNKTVEGLVGGMVCATLATWFAGTYQNWLSGRDALILGLGIALAAPVGDLFESFVKRDAGAKDTGRFFGAHGGALDRLDAVLFTAVTSYYVWSALS
jgi:phosphatidate cytidylyltransferase